MQLGCSGGTSAEPPGRNWQDLRGAPPVGLQPTFSRCSRAAQYGFRRSTFNMSEHIAHQLQSEAARHGFRRSTFKMVEHVANRGIHLVIKYIYFRYRTRSGFPASSALRLATFQLRHRTACMTGNLQTFWTCLSQCCSTRSKQWLHKGKD